MEQMINGIRKHINFAGLEQFERDYLLFQMEKQERRNHWLPLGKFACPCHN